MHGHFVRREFNPTPIDLSSRVNQGEFSEKKVSYRKQNARPNSPRSNGTGYRAEFGRSGSNGVGEQASKHLYLPLSANRQ